MPLLVGADIRFSGSSEINIELSPETPEPGQEISLSANTHKFDIDRSMIVWKHDDVEIARGYGKKSVQVRVEHDLTNVSAIVTKPDGTEITRSVNILPRYVAMIWEADTYTPPFYRGKALPSTGADMQIGTIVSGAKNDKQNNFLFYWYENITNQLVSESGYGKSAFSYSHNLLNERETFDVNIVTSSGITIGKKRLRFDISDFAQLLFFEENKNGRTLYQRELGVFPKILAGDETVSIEGHPLAMTASDKNNFDDIFLQWMTSGNEIFAVDPETHYNKIFIVGDGSGGIAQLDVIAEGINRTFQETSASFDVYLRTEN